MKAYSLPKDIEKDVKENYVKIGKENVAFPSNTYELLFKYLKNIEEISKRFREEYETLEIPKIWKKAGKICKKRCKENIETLSETTKYPVKALEKYIEDICNVDEKFLIKLIKSEIGDPRYLDEFRPSSIGYSKAYGPKCIVHVFPSTIGPQIISTFQASVVKSPSICKPSSEEPLFTAFWVDSVKEVEKEFQNYLVSLPWRGGDEKIEDIIFGREESFVIAYGDMQTLEDIKEKANGKVLEYPFRAGMEIVKIGKKEKKKISKIAQKISYDIVYMDQQACFSPHVIYLLSGDKESHLKFCDELAKALKNTNIPRKHLSIDEKSNISMLRLNYFLQKSSGLDVYVWSDRDYMVIYEEDSSFNFSPLFRTIYVKPLSSLEDLREILKEYKGYLQTVGTNLDTEEKEKLADLLSDYGISRITEIGKVPILKILHHEGRQQITPLIKWIDIET